MMKMFTKSLMFFATSVMAFAQANAQFGGPSVDSVAAIISPGASAYAPITAGQRFRWIVSGTLGAPSLAAGMILAASGTAANSPKEYGPHWDGFGKRYGLRLAGGATSQVLEASIGSIWGEDPRYVRASGQPFKTRIGHVAKMTFLATNRNGDFMPAYARYIAIPSTQFISNAWRPDSQATVNQALVRIPFGFLSTFTSSAFSEFWPDLRGRVSAYRGSR
jgi:hypothetical protein